MALASTLSETLKRQPSSRIAVAAAALITAVSLALIGKGLAIHAKALLAQYLLDRAFAKSLATGQPVKAWSWADTWPVARLEVPRLGASAIVLHGASGEALAFGPGHVDGTPEPGERGTSVIAAHRDTQFTFLRDLRNGDRIRLTRRDGAVLWFRVAETDVVQWDASGIDPDADGHWLALATCWPLDAVTSGDQRLVVRAKMIGRALPGEPQT
jgi:sortase A